MSNLRSRNSKHARCVAVCCQFTLHWRVSIPSDEISLAGNICALFPLRRPLLHANTAKFTTGRVAPVLAHAHRARRARTRTAARLFSLFPRRANKALASGPHGACRCSCFLQGISVRMRAQPVFVGARAHVTGRHACTGRLARKSHPHRRDNNMCSCPSPRARPQLHSPHTHTTMRAEHMHALFCMRV